MKKKLGVIALAAGLGKRMKSGKAKVLHEINGKPMILHVLETASEISGDDIVLVVGHQADEVKKRVSGLFNPIYALQTEQLGTGHALLTALPFVPAHIERLVILYGDVPFLSAGTIRNLRSAQYIPVFMSLIFFSSLVASASSTIFSTMPFLLSAILP